MGFIKGVNVGGKNLVSMSALKYWMGKSGFPNVKTWLQSGNVLFQEEKKTAQVLESVLELEFAKEFGFAPLWIVRTEKDLHDAVESNPFEEESKLDPSHLLVTFLKEESDEELFKTISSHYLGPETLHLSGRVLFTYFSNGIGDSNLFKLREYKQLTLRGTGRNWNTILKLKSLLKELDS